MKTCSRCLQEATYHLLWASRLPGARRAGGIYCDYHYREYHEALLARSDEFLLIKNYSLTLKDIWEPS